MVNRKMRNYTTKIRNKLINNSEIEDDSGLGTSIVKFRKWIRFTVKDRYSKRVKFNNLSNWDLDHIIPLKAKGIDLNNSEHRAVLMHWTNYQILRKGDNSGKGNRLEYMEYATPEMLKFIKDNNIGK